jgi:hypothetical protein
MQIDARACPALPGVSQAGLWTEVRVAHVWGYPVRSCEDDLVTPAKRGKSATRIANTDVRSPAERHVAMSWAQRLKRVFNIDIDIEVCDRCGGSVKVIACIEDQDVIDRILAHLREKEQGRPTLSHLAPHSRAPPEPLPLFAGRESTTLNQQGPY